MKKIAVFLATGLGVGFVPFAPGTFGSVWGLLLVWGLLQLPPLLSGGVSLLIIAAGVPICGMAAKALGKDDPGAVVWDELAAFPIVFCGALCGWFPFNLQTAAIGFVLFRVFDITKPWPARRLERLPGGYGIMADDLAAALYSGIVLTLIADDMFK